MNTQIIKTENETNTLYKCDACKGTGRWRKTTYSYAHGVRKWNGKCHACRGVGGFKTSPEARAKAKNDRLIKKVQEHLQNLAYVRKDIGDDLFSFLSKNNTKNDFFNSLYTCAATKGELTEKQVDALRNSYIKEADYEVQKAENKKPKAEVTLTDLVVKFANAKNNDAKIPVIRAVEGEDVFKFTLAKANSKNPNFIYVKLNDNYFGKISPEGQFFGWNTQKEDLANLIKVCENISQATINYGRKFGNCGFCLKELTTKESMNRGCGKICAEKFGIIT